MIECNSFDNLPYKSIITALENLNTSVPRKSYDILSQNPMEFISNIFIVSLNTLKSHREIHCTLKYLGIHPKYLWIYIPIEKFQELSLVEDFSHKMTHRTWHWVISFLIGQRTVMTHWGMDNLRNSHDSYVTLITLHIRKRNSLHTMSDNVGPSRIFRSPKWTEKILIFLIVFYLHYP